LQHHQFPAVVKKVTPVISPQKILFTAVLFNCVGVFNEVFQNILNHRPLLAFIPDSLKDILMNAFGTVLFVLLVSVMQVNKKQAGAA